MLASIIYGCDSTVTTHLSINSIDTSVSVSGLTLTANASPATYQWIDCDNGNAMITGQIGKSLTAVINGDYAVIITGNNCSDTSSCYTVSTIGVFENNSANSIVIAPNPFNLQTSVTFDQEQKNCSIKIIDMLGKELKSLDFKGSKLIIQRGEMQPGIYFIQIKTEKNIVSKKLIINR